MEMENPYSWRGKAVSFAFLIAMNPAIEKNCFFELLNYFLPEAYLNVEVSRRGHEVGWTSLLGNFFFSLNDA